MTCELCNKAPADRVLLRSQVAPPLGSNLPDVAVCAACDKGFYSLGRLPRQGDDLVAAIRAISEAGHPVYFPARPGKVTL